MNTTNDQLEISTYIFNQIMGRAATHIANGQRSGQALFNAIQEIAPDIAKQLRGTPSDPFYDDDKIDAAMDFLSERLP